MKKVGLLLLLIASFKGDSHPAFFTSRKSGNWNDGAQWGGTSPGVAGTDFPGVNDSPTISSGTNIIIPGGFSTYSDSITMTGGTASTSYSSVTIFGTLNMSSNVVMGDRSSGFSSLILGTGAVVNMNSGNIVLNTRGISGNQFYFNGTATNRIKVNSTSGTFVSGGQGGFNHIDTSWTYVDFNGLNSMATGGNCSTGFNTQIASITWTNSGTLRLPTVRTTPCNNRYIKNSDFRASSATTVIYFQANSLNVPLVENSFIGNTVSTGMGPTSPAQPASGVFLEVDGPTITIRNNVFANVNVLQATTNGLDADMEWNLFVTSVNSNNIGGGGQVLLGSFTVSNNYFYQETDNAHFWGLGGGTHVITNNVLEQNTVNTLTDDGDGYMGSTAGTFSTGTVKNNIGIGFRGNPLLFSFLGGTNLNEFTNFVNNTFWFSTGTTNTTSNACFSIGETYTGKQNQIYYLGNNLCVANSSDTLAHIERDLSIPTAPNKVSTADYNGSFNIAGQDRGTLYQSSSTGNSAYGIHDSSANPNFLSPGNDFITFDTFAGGVGTSSNATGMFLQSNGYGGPINPAYTIQSLLRYVQTAYTPQAMAYKRAGFDGSDTGAIPIIPRSAWAGF